MTMIGPVFGPWVQYGLIQGTEIRDTTEGQLIVTPCKVNNVPILLTDTPDQVLTKVIDYLPGLFTPHPDSKRYPHATLRERAIRSVPAVNQAIVDLIYRGPGPSDWALEDTTEMEMLQTFATARGTNALTLWYKKGTGVGVSTAPTDSDQVPGSVNKLFPRRVMRIRGFLTAAQWNPFAISVRAALGTINSLQWGANPLDSRGTWLFAGLTLTTNDFNRTYHAQVFFINDKLGHYPVRPYFNIHGEHPPDSVTEAAIRAVGPPPVDGVITRNGIGMFSIYDETDFNSLFNFTPIW